MNSTTSDTRNRSGSGTIKIGVSACLTGQLVRYDGGLKTDPIVTGLLAERFELVTVCPEVEVGMSTPREAIDLVGDPVRPSLIAKESGRDWTQEMGDWTRARSLGLAGEDLCGFVFKKNSPSCGLHAVPVIQENGESLAVGRGMFAAAFARTHPLLPLEDEDRLAVPRIREHFLERVYACDRLGRAFSGNWQLADAVEFHRRERLLLTAHSPERCRDLDELAATVSDFRPSAYRDRYRSLFMEAMSVRPSTQGHLEAMGLLADHLRGQLSPDEQRALIHQLEDFRAERISLRGPLELLAKYIALHDVTEAKDQTYLDPCWLEA